MTVVAQVAGKKNIEEQPTRLKKQDAWIASVDLEAFRADIRAVGERLKKGQGAEDSAHLERIIFYSNAFALAGFVLAGVVPWYYFGAAALLSVGITSRWTMVAHHVCHGGYQKCDKTGKYNRFKFAFGSIWRRAIDWFDWMLPEAWDVEHNHLHHYCLGEETDPDLVERNLEDLRDSGAPVVFKYGIVLFIMATWKWIYYAPNTFKELRVNDMRKSNPKVLEKDKAEFIKRYGFDFTTYPIFAFSFWMYPLPKWLSGWECLARVVGPYFCYRFVIFPVPWLALGFLARPEDPMCFYKVAVANCLFADVLTNIHSFIIIVTNHAGSDLYKFSTKCHPASGTFYLRQIISSVNFAAGSDAVDFMHGWLNYQVEHHLFPDLSMLSYRRAMPEIKEICARHNVPYLQESVFVRLKKTVDIMTGAASMRPFPVDVLDVK